MDDRFRTSDADRDRAATLLREHFAAGRLTAAELDERLATALNAKTFGDLRRVLADLPEPGPAQQQPRRLQPDRGGLERWYRWLLACYPAAYRRVHEEEMLAVLMTAAPHLKRRPGIAEAADLIWGALRVRCQPSRSGAEPAWRDALAVLSVVLPVIVLVTTAVLAASTLPFVPVALNKPLWVLNQFAAPLALLALALLALARRPQRRVIALTPVAGLLWLGHFSGLPGLSFSFVTSNPYILLALGLQILAVTTSAGPRRGVELLTWKHVAFTVIAAVTVAIASYPLILVVILVICAAMALTSSLGRWLLVLLAIPIGPYVAIPYLYASPWGPHMNLDIASLMSRGALGPYGQAYVLAAVFLGLFVVAACRESLRSRKLATPSQ